MDTQKSIDELYEITINDIKKSEHEGKITREYSEELQSMWLDIRRWGSEEKISQECVEKLQPMRLTSDISTKERMQVFLCFKRNYNMVRFLIESGRYTADDIYYYLFSNKLKEVSFIGLSFYFDIKFTKGQENEFLYRCDGDKYKDKKENPDDKILNPDDRQNDLVKTLLQLSQIHVSKRIGNENKQRDWFESYSACLGRVLHKYFDPCGWEKKTTLKIAKAGKLNTIQIGENAPKTLQMAALQIDDVEPDIAYCWKNSDKIAVDDHARTVEFCIGMYNVRDNKNENFERWSKRFSTDKEWNELVGATDTQNVTREDRLIGAVPDMETVATREYLDSACQEELDVKECIVLLYRYYEEYIRRNPDNDKAEEKKIEDLQKKTKRVLEQFLEKFKEEKKGDDKLHLLEGILREIDQDHKESDLNKKFKDIFEKYVNWETECRNMKNIYIDMLLKGQNKHVNPSIFYGLDFKNKNFEEMGFIIRDNDYRKFMSKIKLTMLNEAVYDGNGSITFNDNVDYKRYEINLKNYMTTKRKKG